MLSNTNRIMLQQLSFLGGSPSSIEVTDRGGDGDLGRW
jgi:hypothetical protein